METKRNNSGNFCEFNCLEDILLIKLQALCNYWSNRMDILIAEALARRCVRRCSLAGLACNFIKKETLAQVFSCEFCEISKNTFLHRTPLVAASFIVFVKSSNQRDMCPASLLIVYQVS